MKSLLSLIFLFFVVTQTEASQRLPQGKTVYLSAFFGHLHQNPTRVSQSLTTIACGHPLKLLKEVDDKKNETTIFAESWLLVSAGPYEGFVHQDFVSEKKSTCFQDSYPRFFNELGLEVTDMFYWGRLYDHYERGRSSIP